MLPPIKGEANNEKSPSTSGRNGTGIFANVEPPIYGGPIPSTHLNHVGPPPKICLLYTSPSPRDVEESRMPSSA